MPMFFFNFHAVPIDPETAPGVIGAYVNCWVQDSIIEKAEITARTGIENEGWKISGHDTEPYQTTRKDWFSGENLEYFDQALIDREVWVFHTYAHDDED
jgi:hypothetical protein